jgi:hypothetical protein
MYGKRRAKKYALIGHNCHLNRVLVEFFDESANVLVVVWRGICVVRCRRIRSRGGCGRLAKCLLIR